MSSKIDNITKYMDFDTNKIDESSLKFIQLNPETLVTPILYDRESI